MGEIRNAHKILVEKI